MSNSDSDGDTSNSNNSDGDTSNIDGDASNRDGNGNGNASSSCSLLPIKKIILFFSRILLFLQTTVSHYHHDGRIGRFYLVDAIAIALS